VSPLAAGAAAAAAPVQVAKQYDPESKSHVWTRSDLTVFTRYADGSSLAQHADGTRIFTDREPQGRFTRFVVECPEFAPVVVMHEDTVALSAGSAAGGQQTAAAADSGNKFGSDVKGIKRQQTFETTIHVHDGTTIKV
jgi:hypothetical protein